MGLYRGAGGSGDAVNDSSSEALITIQARDAALAAQAAAEAAQTAAELAETNAETAETNAETAETNAETAATNAANSASAASTSASNAASSASAASTSASNASTSATNAANSASAASTSASNAASSASTASTQATNASNSASAAATSATNASNSASAAATSATNAANSATAAQTARTAAELAETNAETAEANAETAETNAAASASAAATSASNASTSASNAATSATNASNSASAAATSATNASNSASAAATSATNASNSASAAATSASNAAASYDSFDDRYLGAKSSAPTLDNDGNTLLVGALYYDTVSSSMKVWSGSAWLDAYASLSGALLATNNLSDLNNTATARTNLGLGSIATQAANNVAVTGGSINGTTVGASTASSGRFTTLEATGVTTVQAGTVSAPAITTSGDTNTGIFFPAADTIAFAEGGVEALRIDSSGNVGIGTTATLGNSLLNVAQGVVARNVSTTLPYFQTYNANAGTDLKTWRWGGNSSGAFAFETVNDAYSAANERMRIDSSGNVMIGTTTARGRLHSTASSFNPSGGNVWASSASFTASGAFGGGLTLVDGTAGYGLWVQDAGGTFAIGQGSISGNLTERMRIDSSGNVGIGTSTMLGRLTAIGNIVANGGGTGDPEFRLSGASGGVTRNYAMGTDGAQRLYWYDYTAAAYRMLIDSSGNVGIGTSSPTNKLDVVGNMIVGDGGNTRGLYVGPSGFTGAFLYRADGNCEISPRSGYSLLFMSSPGGTERMRITSGGDVLVGTTTTGGILRVFGSSGRIIIGDSSVNYYDGDTQIFRNYAATERMRIDSAGRVGIGNSIPSSFNAFANQLVVGNGSSSQGITIYASNASSISFADGTAGNQSYEGYINYNHSVDAMDFYVNYTGSPSPRMRIDSSGNVGIGTTSPVAKLSVDHAIALTGAGAAKPASLAYGMYLLNGVGTVLYSAASTAFYAGDTERMRIDSAGNVGIGTTAPTSTAGFTPRLQLTSAASTALIVTSTGTTQQNAFATNGSGLFIESVGSATATDNNIIFRTTGTNSSYGGIERMRITSTGQLRTTVTGTTMMDEYGCRAWVNFNGTGTVAIRASGNVSSITDNGTGDYTVNFTNAMPDANYNAIVTSGGWGSAYNYSGTYVGAGTTPTTTALRVATRTGATFDDQPAVCVSVFR